MIMMHKQGFSLIELSIVLVILGLLTGGILSGQSLIRAAELRAITSEYQQFETTVHSFRGKYGTIPGDLSNATAFWGSAVGASCQNNQASGNGTGTNTCNGDGNGYVTHGIHHGSVQNAYVEMFMFWQHLANAKMIHGTFTGRSGQHFFDDATIGVNVPTSKFSGGGWSILDDILPEHQADNNSNTYTTNHTYPMIFGGQRSAWELYEPLLTPEEAWNIDSKMDDGIGIQGNVVMELQYNDACRTYHTTPHTYDLARSEKICTLIFRR